MKVDGALPELLARYDELQKAPPRIDNASLEGQYSTPSFNNWSEKLLRRIDVVLAVFEVVEEAIAQIAMFQHFSDVDDDVMAEPATILFIE